MDDKKIIAVVGATGIQGGGLARAILDDAAGAFALRAITRNPNSEAAVALAERGAEVVQADLDDAKTLDAALGGAFGAFFVTNYWEHFSVEREQDQARNLADAAARTGVEHVVWSTLEDTRNWMSLDDDRMPTLKEKYKVPHLDGKGEVDPHFVELGVPTTFFHTCFYWENLIYAGLGPQRGEDGRLHFNLPMQDKKLPGIAAEDIGRCAYGIFRQGSQWIGQRLGVSGEHLSGAEMAAALADALGEEVQYNSVPFEVFRELGFPGADDLGNMFQFKADFTEDYRGCATSSAPAGSSRGCEPSGSGWKRTSRESPSPDGRWSARLQSDASGRVCGLGPTRCTRRCRARRQRRGRRLRSRPSDRTPRAGCASAPGRRRRRRSLRPRPTSWTW